MNLSLDVFDPVSRPGAGPNFDPDQSPLNLLNIPIRDLRLPAALYPGASIPGFLEWLPQADCDPDRFPERAELGGYLEDRYRDLAQNGPDNLHVALHSQMVHHVERRSAGWWFRTGTDIFGAYDEVLLTPGQPSTVLDEQLSRWQTHAIHCGADLISAYPDHLLLQAAKDWTGRSVAVRGMGLSMFDVLRLLTRGAGGRFENGRYHASGREPARILPFSLDGQPPFPKPATREFDTRFDPQESETSQFEDALTRALSQEPAEALNEICEALVYPALRIMRAAGSKADKASIFDWLAAEQNSPGALETKNAKQSLQAGIAMARGQSSPTEGFVIGQIWRKWQDRLRSIFNTTIKSAMTAKALVDFDEGLKRYSYGPPVRSAEELLILVESGLVDLRAVEDPDVLLLDDGWQLVEDDGSAKVSAMVDAVLPIPSPRLISNAVIADLIEKDMMCTVAEGLGARTLPDGRLVGCDGRVLRGMCLLGRLSNGSNIAVDSIHDCFGDVPSRWATGVIERVFARRIANQAN